MTPSLIVRRLGEELMWNHFLTSALMLTGLLTGCKNAETTPESATCADIRPVIDESLRQLPLGGQHRAVHL